MTTPSILPLELRGVSFERDLPRNQKSIRLGRLNDISTPCGIDNLRVAVETARPAEHDLKAAQSQPAAGHGVQTR